MSARGPHLRIFVAHPSSLLTDHVSNGDGLVAFGFISRLAARGHEVHVAAQRVEVRGDLPPSLRIHPLSPRGDGTSARDRAVFMWRMRRLYEQLQRIRSFDVVHQMNPVFTGLSLSLIGARTPLVLGSYVPRWERGSDEESRSTMSRLWLLVGEQVERLQQANAAGLLIVSRHAMSRIAAPERHRDRIYEIPHGIDLGRFDERPSVPDRASILFLAGVSRKKGIFTLLEAFERVAGELPGSQLVIAGGDGGALKDVRRMASAFPDGSVRILGPIPRNAIRDLLHRHSVFCVPSYGEPFGMSNLEAMACGVPVVATRAGGVPDLVSEDGGRLVPPGDAEALAAALLEILRSRPLQARMGRANRQRAERVFDAERTVDALERVYHAVITRHSRTRGVDRPAPVAAAPTVSSGCEPTGYAAAGEAP